MRSNKDVVVFERSAGRRLLLVSVDMKNELGAIADLSNRLEKMKINVLSGFISGPGKDNVGRCSFFAELHDPRLTADQVKAELESSASITGCTIKEAHGGLLVDSLNFPLSWNNGDRAVMLRTEFFAMMKNKVGALLGSGADTMLYELGYEHGHPSWKNLMVNYRVSNKEDLQEFLHFYDAVGWGRVEVISYEPSQGTATVRIHDNFECMLAKVRQPSSHFVRGHIAGAFANVTGRNVELEETSCIAAGGQFCEFQVRPADGPLSH